MSKKLFFSLVLMLHFLPGIISPDNGEVIKLGTLATEESDWGKTFNQMNAELIKQSNGEIKLQIHFGRDEKDLVDLIRSKQLDAVSLSVPGLGQILHEVFIFQLPMLFSSYEELDYVREGLSPYFLAQFNNKGFSLLGWGDLGFAYLYSKYPVKTQTDLQKTTLWVMDNDLVAKEFASASSKDYVLLPVQNVMASLSRDDIQTVYGPPLGCIALQWYTQLNYMTDFPLVAGIGATIMDRDRFEKLSRQHKGLLQEIMEKYHRQLVNGVRQQNEESINVLKKQGIEIITVPYQEKLKWKQIASRVKNRFVGELYDKELLERLEALLEEYNKDN